MLRACSGRVHIGTYIARARFVDSSHTTEISWLRVGGWTHTDRSSGRPWIRTFLDILLCDWIQDMPAPR